MQITPEWIAIMLTLMGMSGGAGAWLQQRRDAARHAMPIVRVQWKSGTAGFTAEIEVINRLNEDLRVLTAEAKGKFVWYEYERDAGGSITSSTLHSSPSPKAVDVGMAPGNKVKFSLSVEGAATPRWLRLTMSSSNNTLRCKRTIIRDSQKA